MNPDAEEVHRATLLSGTHPSPRPTRPEWALAFVALFLTSKAILMLFVTGGERATIDLAEGSALFQVLAASVYGACALLTVVRPKALMPYLSSSLLFVALLALAALSTAWSLQPAITFRRVVALFGTTGVAFFIVSRFTFEQFVTLLLWLFFSLTLSSVLLLVAVPDLAIHFDELHLGAWRGAFAHKNNLGEAMAIGILVFLLSSRSALGPRSVTAIGLALAFLLLFMSGSKASMVATAIALSVFPALALIRQPARIAVPFGLALLLVLFTVIAFISLNVESLLLSLGRDLTLTGRTILWQSAFFAGLDHPILGVGYRAFWLGEGGGIGALGSGASNFALTIDHGHNGFLDIWLELGIPGLALLLGILISYLRSAFAFAARRRSGVSLLPLLLFVLLMPVSFATTVMLDRNNYIWIIFVTFLLYIRVPVRRHSVLDGTTSASPQ